MKEGPCTVYSEQGYVTEKGDYKNDVKTGLWKEYYPNEKIKAEGMYINDEKIGEWKEYDELGKLTKTVKY